jgi:S-adenosylmethionine:tRNA-ribosyltransferase-isomerase (queuine synthetase)
MKVVRRMVGSTVSRSAYPKKDYTTNFTLPGPTLLSLVVNMTDFEDTTRVLMT